MAPKAAAKAAAMGRTKAAGQLLTSSKEVKNLSEQKKALRATLSKLAQQKKKAQREARKLKAKANKTDLGELLQMMMMKAYIVGEEQKSRSEGASSSTDPWVPANAKEAFQKICQACSTSDEDDVASFANLLRDGA